MNEASSLPPPLPASSGPDRPAAWWSWPLIFLSVLFIGWSVNIFAPEAIEEVKAEEGAVEATDLALFKIQAQVIIAAAGLREEDAREGLEELRALARNETMLMALALLEEFLAIEGLDPLKTLEGVSSQRSPETRALAEKAIQSGLNDSERDRLGQSLGWFAQLAKAEDGSPAPERQAIQTRSVLFLGMAGLLFSGAVLAVLAGAVLLLLPLRQTVAERSPNRFSPSDLPRGVMLESFALYLAVMALGDLGGQFLHPGFSYTGYLVAVILPFLWPFFRGVSWRDFRRSIGWHRGEGVWNEIWAGCVGYLKVMAIASIGIFLTLILSAAVGAFAGGGGETGGSAPVGPQTHPIVGWIYLGGWKEKLLCFFLAAVFAPVFEELFFRGALHRWLRGRFPFLVSALLTGAIFAALHPQGWLGIPALAAIGVGFSLLRESRDSLIAPMVAHALNNGILVVVLSIALA